MFKKVKQRIFEVLEVAAPDDVLSRIFDVFIMLLIFLNVVAVILGTVETISSKYCKLLKTFELISVIIFTIEYVLRIWTCTINKKYKHPITDRIKFALTPLILVDLLAILPFYLPMVILIDLRFLRVIRLVRFFRLFKMYRYSKSLHVFGYVLKSKKEEMAITLFMILILLVVASSLMYFFENQAQPKVFSSIPASMWWGIVTLTTVGYGDVYPITPLGKCLGAFIALLGIGIFALPAGILASGFAEAIQKNEKEQNICPHCGKKINKL